MNLQIQDEKIELVPILAQNDINDDTLKNYVLPLAEILKVKDADLPHIYFFNPRRMKAEPFPDKLDDIEK